MSVFDIDRIILSAMSEDDDSTYNSIPAKVIVELDLEVETEGGVFMKKNVASISSIDIPDPQRGDEIKHLGVFYRVESVISDDGKMKMLEIRSS